MYNLKQITLVSVLTNQVIQDQLRDWLERWKVTIEGFSLLIYTKYGLLGEERKAINKQSFCIKKVP